MSTLEKLGALPLAPPEELLPPLDIPPLEAPPLEAPPLEVPPLEEPDDLSLPEAPLDEDPVPCANDALAMANKAAAVAVPITFRIIECSPLRKLTYLLLPEVLLPEPVLPLLPAAELGADEEVPGVEDVLPEDDVPTEGPLVTLFSRRHLSRSPPTMPRHLLAVLPLAPPETPVLLPDALGALLLPDAPEDDGSPAAIDTLAMANSAAAVAVPTSFNTKRILLRCKKM